MAGKKAFTPDLVVPFVQKRDAYGSPTRKKARIIDGYLVSRGKLPDTHPAYMAGVTSRYMAQL